MKQFHLRAALMLLPLILCTVIRGQGLNNLWMLGYASHLGLPWGGTNIDFASGAADISYVDREMDFGRTAANITDSNGSLLCCTNGYYIANAQGDTMTNGTGINPSGYTSQYPDGLNICQADLFLPQPDGSSIYYLLHMTIDNIGSSTGQYLYLTTIDMNLDGGLGGVVSKNIVLVNDGLNEGRITAVRHANGRDWWVVCHKANSNTFYRLLVTPSGVAVDGTQAVGIVRPPDAGQSCFSPDGSKYAYYWGEQDLEVFDFDRCTGTFSNPVFIATPDSNAGPGVAFSPNSRYLYVSSILDVYQYDVQASDIAASMQHIATWDGFYSPNPPFATVFDAAQLAPDGRIYIATGNGTDKLHVINSPDLQGAACEIQQHAISLPTYNFNSLPNHPNYHLGPLAGSPCDTLGLGMMEHPAPLHLRAYPNPASGYFVLNYPAQSQVGMLEVRDLSGRIVLHERIPQWSTAHTVDLAEEAGGMYQCEVKWRTRMASVRVIINR